MHWSTCQPVFIIKWMHTFIIYRERTKTDLDDVGAKAKVKIGRWTWWADGQWRAVGWSRLATRLDTQSFQFRRRTETYIYIPIKNRFTKSERDREHLLISSKASHSEFPRLYGRTDYRPTESPGPGRPAAQLTPRGPASQSVRQAGAVSSLSLGLDSHHHPTYLLMNECISLLRLPPLTHHSSR